MDTWSQSWGATVDIHLGRWTAGTYSHHPFRSKENGLPPNPYEDMFHVNLPGRMLTWNVAMDRSNRRSSPEIMIGENMSIAWTIEFWVENDIHRTSRFRTWGGKIPHLPLAQNTYLALILLGMNENLGGGFNDFLFSSLLGEMIPFD